ncbi:MAG: hypothetical protein HPY58_12750 [Firmicutes bacterium]|nr:hypothetical protein [Bacillota bacterium]
MAYTKTTWVNGGAPGISAENLNKIEAGIEAAHKMVETDIRTPDQNQAAQASGTLLQLQSFFANMIRRITGKTNWYDAPDTTLAAAASHISAAAPHAGHETPSGAQAKVDAHAALTATHGATSAATANRIILRDASGRAKVAAPVASDDIATKGYVDVFARVLAGSYVGDGKTDRLINIGVTPKLVMVVGHGSTGDYGLGIGIAGTTYGVGMSGSSPPDFRLMKQNGRVAVPEITTNGFYVSFSSSCGSLNKPRITYYYVAIV